MPFADAVPALLGDAFLAPWELKVIRYLNTECLGSQSAKSWDDICAACEIDIDQRIFQHGLLAKTRDGDVFIGSGSKGYFIIQSQQDAEVIADFYRSRISRETEHLFHLEALLNDADW